MEGQGRSLTHLFDTKAPLEEATRVAMRDAAADLAIGFAERPRIREWLAEERSLVVASAR